MLPLTIALACLALLGHAALWVGLVNRWHATGYRRAIIKSVTLAFYAGLLLVPVAALLTWTHTGTAGWQDRVWQLNWASCYAAIAAGYGAIHLPRWAWERWAARRRPSQVRPTANQVVDIERELGYAPRQGLRAAVLSHVPGNQLWQLHVSEFAIRMPRLAEQLEGLRVCHWSDLHLSGRIDRRYFEEIVRLTNQARPDLIALTGDVCDAAACIEWIPETFAPAEARLGKYFILGNHDLRTRDVARLRAAMAQAGFVDLGGRRQTIDEGRIEIAGNERPWFSAPPDEVATAAGRADDRLRILLAHTPDQLAWARAGQFDLMLAGHTHGGQIRFPIVGPVICPSWHGTKYAAGFFDAPPTLLHVSRGTASLLPLRLNCPPEITTLVLSRA
jgi:uncharacterized protein